MEGNPNVQHYRFKGTKDIIRISAVLNNESIKNWEKSVKNRIEGFNAGEEIYTENLDLTNAKGTIQMFDEYYIPNNYLYYQNKKAGVSLQIIYMSNESNENRLKNMRLILKELKTETF